MSKRQRNKQRKQQRAAARGKDAAAAAAAATTTGGSRVDEEEGEDRMGEASDSSGEEEEHQEEAAARAPAAALAAAATDAAAPATGGVCTPARAVAAHVVPGVGSACPECGSRLQMGGPLWMGELHDRAFLQRALERVQQRTDLATHKRIQGMLTSVRTHACAGCSS